MNPEEQQNQKQNENFNQPKNPEMTPPTEIKNKEEGGAGALIGSIIVIVILIIGTIYLWNIKISPRAQDSIENENKSPRTALNQSDELSNIEIDLQNTIIDLETEFNDLEISL